MRTEHVFSISFDVSTIQVKKEAIIKLLGVDVTTCDDHTRETVESCLSDYNKLIQPKGGFIIYPITHLVRKEGILRIENNAFNIHKIISGQLKETKFIAAFMCTIGNAVEKLSKAEMQKGNMLEGYIYDLIGSEAAEALAEKIHQAILHEAQKHAMKITNRFSPGYCNWDIVEQFKLFRLFGNNTFDIHLTDSALMSPIKSVSGIVGIGENVTFKEYTCTMCGDEKCIYRNKKS